MFDPSSPILPWQAHSVGIKLEKYKCPFKVKPSGWDWWRANVRQLRWANHPAAYQPWLIPAVHFKLVELHTKIEAGEARENKTAGLGTKATNRSTPRSGDGYREKIRRMTQDRWNDAHGQY